MANPQHPGFYPSRLAGTGGEVTYRRRRVLDNNTDAIYCQDTVIAVSDGNTTSPGVTSTRTTLVDTVFMGASYQDANGVRIGAKSLPAATRYTGTGVYPDDGIYISVVENPVNVIFVCSIDSAMALTNLRNNFDINLAAGVNGFSQQELRGASSNTTAALPIRFTGDFIENGRLDITAAHAWVEAQINQGASEPVLTVDGLGV